MTIAQVTLLANILLSLFFSTLDSNRQCPTQPGSVLCWTPVYFHTRCQQISPIDQCSEKGKDCKTLTHGRCLQMIAARALSCTLVSSCLSLERHQKCFKVHKDGDKQPKSEPKTTQTVFSLKTSSAQAFATCLFFFGFGCGLGNIFFVLVGEVN